MLKWCWVSNSVCQKSWEMIIDFDLFNWKPKCCETNFFTFLVACNWWLFVYFFKAICCYFVNSFLHLFTSSSCLFTSFSCLFTFWKFLRHLSWFSAFSCLQFVYIFWSSAKSLRIVLPAIGKLVKQSRTSTTWTT